MSTLGPRVPPPVSQSIPPSPDWHGIAARYQGSSARRALGQVATTLGPLAAAFYLMYRALAWSHGLMLLLAIPTAGLLIRTFVIMHDCSHGSFLAWRRGNDLVGYLTGVITLTPFGQWRHEHALHHASSGDLDRRGNGDITTLTVREYLGRTRWGRVRYRLFRHPAVMLGLGPLNVIFGQRVIARPTAGGARDTRSVWATNAGIAIVVLGFALVIGVRAVAWIYLPVCYLAAAGGIWLFYVQHQFDGAYWEPHKQWDFATAAIAGSSYLKLPGVLRWLTASIGLHHVHHLAPRIPNYRLQRCHDENDLFHRAHVVTLAGSLRLFRLALWDEDQHRLVGFDHLRAYGPAHGAAAVGH